MVKLIVLFLLFVASGAISTLTHFIELQEDCGRSLFTQFE